MTAIYLFAAIFGGALVVLFVLGGGDLESDIGDVDLEGGVDLDDLGVDGTEAGGFLQLLGALLSLRNIVFFAAFFGVAGLLLGLIGLTSVVVAVLAIAVGLGAATANHKLFAYLKRSSSDSTVGNERIAGNIASVVLPIARERKGRVAVEVDGQRMYLVALPYHAERDDHFEVGDQVVIVVVENGSALVTAAEF